MRKIVVAMAGLAVLAMVSGAAAQSSPSQGSQSPAPMMGPGMMGGMPCPPAMGHQMMGMGMGMGMEHGMMSGMMGMSDPKAAARMLKLRGDILKAIGDVMLKHAQALEQEK